MVTGITAYKRIPFDVSVDPFYSESNITHLRRGVEALNAGKVVCLYGYAYIVLFVGTK